MPINSRNKGASFERKFCSYLNGWLGCNARRRISQYQAGGSDIEFIGDTMVDVILNRYSFECKNYQRITDSKIKQFWEQAVKQAADEGKHPVLVYQESRQGIKVVMESQAMLGFRVTMDLEDWVNWVRESL